MAEIFKFVHVLMIFLSLIVLVSSNKLFCYTTDDCDKNICHSPPFVMNCRLFLCLCENKHNDNLCMQRRKNMNKTLKFIHVLIIIFSLIALVTSYDSSFCFTDDDCKENKCYKGYITKCRLYICICEPTD
ncbi:uncharacterized protein LOC123891650 [Trifolium pratense]|uniref:uncharacterized protein LOC123891650 n=1 Tax=Trifolium pratense TaxID=57577 RepID=UPI001E690655|nr:uncharacterized protein LOC123891650 [Trifolium pratense]